jgi:hypothetical protein
VSLIGFKKKQIYLYMSKEIDATIRINPDTKIYQTALANLFNGLNTANIKGTFGIKESRQLCNDIDVIASLISQICKNTE